MTTTKPANTTTETTEVFTVQGTSGTYARLSLARSAAAIVTLRLRHGVQIFKNGKLIDYKRF
jgi:hypothetical protein